MKRTIIAASVLALAAGGVGVASAKPTQSNGAQKVLSGLPDAGYIQIGERRTPIKYAFKTATDAGDLVTVATAVPIVYLGAVMPYAKPTAVYDVSFAILDAKKSGGTV